MLIKVTLGTSESQIAIFEGENPEAVIAKLQAEIKIPDGQSWEPNPYDPSGVSWLIFDPSLHENIEQAADYEGTTYLSASPVVLGEFWDPDLE